AQPARQRRAEVERHAIVVVDDRLDVAGAVVDAGERVGAVALGVNARVPVVNGHGRRVARHAIGPGILPRRLIEVAVEAEGDRSGGVRRQKFRLRVSRGSLAFWTTVTPPSLTV